MNVNVNVANIQTTNRRMLIGGELVDAESGATMEIESPGDGGSLGQVPAATVADVDRAVQAARRASEGWRYTDIMVRRQKILDFARLLRENAELVASLDAIDSGSPINAMRVDVAGAAFYLEWVAGMAFSWSGDTAPVTGTGVNLTLREPHGVVAGVIPFNHPAFFAAKIAAPLITGNTVVLKIPDQTPLSGLWMAEQLAALFPPGVVNIISGQGAVAGAALVSHPGIDAIYFTGSVPTGRAIYLAAAARFLPVRLELGGKNPLIICADADLDQAVAVAVKGMNYNTQGQSCGSYSRLFLHEKIHDEFLEALKVRIAQIRVGHPLDESAGMGPLITERARDRSESYVKAALSGGARLVSGGSRPKEPALQNGWYFEPTVVAGVTQDMPIACEEIFGPVQSVLRWNDVDAVLAEANATEFGLTANIFTRDLERAFHMVRKIDSGSVAVNGDGLHHRYGSPFGGFKASGLGSEEGLGELLGMTREKNVYLNLPSPTRPMS